MRGGTYPVASEELQSNYPQPRYSVEANDQDLQFIFASKLHLATSRSIAFRSLQFRVRCSGRTIFLPRV